MTEFHTEQTKRQAIETFHEKGLPSATEINSQFQDAIVSISEGVSFRNNTVTVKFSPSKEIRIQSTSTFENFGDMIKKRGDAPANLKLWQGIPSNQIPLSNVGVSVALTVTIGEKRYAALVKRPIPDGVKLMLVSGYTDFSKFHDPSGEHLPLSLRASLFANSLAELSEEILWSAWRTDDTKEAFSGLGFIRSESTTHERFMRENEPNEFGEMKANIAVGNDMISFHDPYDFPKFNEVRLPLCLADSLPTYLRGLFEDRSDDSDSLTFDNARYFSSSGFYFRSDVNGGQLVTSFEVSLSDFIDEPFPFPGLNATAAEDGLFANSPEKKELLERLGINPFEVLCARHNDQGLVLVELNDNGDLTSNFYRLCAGELTPDRELSDLDQVHLSDVFTVAASSRRGITERDSIPVLEYLKALEMS